MAVVTMSGTTLQVRPWPGSAAWNTVTLSGGLAPKSQTWGKTLPAGVATSALSAVNQFANQAVATADRIAQEIMHAVGLEIRNDASLSTAQTTDGVTANVFDRGEFFGSATITIVSTIGATPTVTLQIEGSPDNSAWAPLSTADSATPTVFSTATFTITTATTTVRIVNPASSARYIRVTLSATTNVTTTIDVAAV